MSQRITRRIGRAYPDVFRGTKVSSRSVSYKRSEKVAASVRSKVADARSSSGRSSSEPKSSKRVERHER